MENTAPRPEERRPLVRPMRVVDLPRVEQIERLSFPYPRTHQLLEREITEQQRSHYRVIEVADTVVGYAGYWHICEEAHLVTLAVDPGYRKQGLGKKLLQRLIDDCRSLHLARITLEVRESNTAAQQLYENSGFKKVAVQSRYYFDTDEDALVYWKLL